MFTEVERNMLKLHESQNIVDTPTCSFICVSFSSALSCYVVHPLHVVVVHHFCVSVYQCTKTMSSSCVSVPLLTHLVSCTRRFGLLGAGDAISSLRIRTSMRYCDTSCKFRCT